jgi:hypothetical protein
MVPGDFTADVVRVIRVQPELVDADHRDLRKRPVAGWFPQSS